MCLFTTEAKKKPKVQIGNAIYMGDSSGTPYEPSEDDVEDDDTLPSDAETTDPESVEEELGDDVGMYIRKPYMIIIRRLFTRLTHHISTVL